MNSGMSGRRTVAVLILSAVLAVAGVTQGRSDSFHLEIGTGNFYMAVGDYDYYPYYRHSSRQTGYVAAGLSFHDALGGYGYWQYVPTVGVEVWFPYVDYSWRPYQYGHWIWTPDGWTWVAYEPWGWIPHHFGNWVYLDLYGWAWVPGYEYRPAWVTWGVANGYIGWAPLAPPWYTYQHHRDYRYHGDGGWYRRGGWRGDRGYSGIDYPLWVFVANDRFYDQDVSRHALLPGRGADFFREGRVMPLGQDLDIDYVRKVSQAPIHPVSMDRQVYRVDGREVAYQQPRGQEQKVRGSALRTVNEAVAPGFARHGVRFKGETAKSREEINRIFGQRDQDARRTTYREKALDTGMANDPYFQKQKRNLGEAAVRKTAETRGREDQVGKTTSARGARSVGKAQGAGADRQKDPRGKAVAVPSGNQRAGKAQGTGADRQKDPRGKAVAVPPGKQPAGERARETAASPKQGKAGVDGRMDPSGSRTGARGDAGATRAQGWAPRGGSVAKDKQPDRPRGTRESSARSAQPPSQAAGRPAGARSSATSGAASQQGKSRQRTKMSVPKGQGLPHVPPSAPPDRQGSAAKRPPTSTAKAGQTPGKAPAGSGQTQQKSKAKGKGQNPEREKKAKEGQKRNG